MNSKPTNTDSTWWKPEQKVEGKVKPEEDSQVKNTEHKPGTQVPVVDKPKVKRVPDTGAGPVHTGFSILHNPHHKASDTKPKYSKQPEVPSVDNPADSNTHLNVSVSGDSNATTPVAGSPKVNRVMTGQSKVNKVMTGQSKVIRILQHPDRVGNKPLAKKSDDDEIEGDIVETIDKKSSTNFDEMSRRKMMMKLSQFQDADIDGQIIDALPKHTIRMPRMQTAENIEDIMAPGSVTYDNMFRQDPPLDTSSVRSDTSTLSDVSQGSPRKTTPGKKRIAANFDVPIEVGQQ